MSNAGKYNQPIKIYSVKSDTDDDDFPVTEEILVGSFYAEVITTGGMTLIKADTDFEKAYTRFNIRFPKADIKRGMLVKHRGKTYEIKYANNINNENIELELQCESVVK